MAPKSRLKRGTKRAAKPGWWRSLDLQRFRWIVRPGIGAVLVIALGSAGAVGLSRLETHVNREVVKRHVPSVSFVDLPEKLEPFAKDDLTRALGTVSPSEWTGDSLCREMATSLGTVGWVAEVNYVRRRSDALFEISCRYRLPVAVVEHGREFFLVDRGSIRLPGTYIYDQDWKLVQGVRVLPPPPGTVWESQALRDGLAILAALDTEPFRHQITGVLVENAAGRIDPRRCHIELATDRGDGWIRWGSAPGMEMEENLLEQKLAILRENFRRSGRVDEHHQVIDVSIFPDRYTIPG